MRTRRNRHFTAAPIFAVAIMAASQSLVAQDALPESDIAEPRSLQRIQPVEPPDGISSDRILGVIPNFQTVSDPTKPITPLSRWQKVDLFVKETADPFTFVSAAMGAALSQAGDGTPRYGVGMVPYSQRLGAAFLDMATQNFFSDAILATTLARGSAVLPNGSGALDRAPRGLLSFAPGHYQDGFG